MAFKLITWNPDGLTRATSGRLQQLQDILSSYQPDALLLQETYWKEGVHQPTFPGYVVFRSDRAGRGGGTAVLLSNAYKATQIAIGTQNIQLTAIQVVRSRPVLLVSAYSPTARLSKPELRALLSRPGDMVMAGDLNARHTELGGTINSKNGNVLYSMIGEDRFHLYVPPEPTHCHHSGRHAPNVLDFALSNRPFAVQCQVLQAGTSDHLPVLFTIADLGITRPPIAHNTFLRVNWEAVTGELEEVPWQTLRDVADVDERLNGFILAIQTADLRATATISTKSRTHHVLPRHILLLKQDKLRAQRALRVDKGNVVLRRHCRALERRVHKAIRQFKASRRMRTVELITAEGRLWKTYLRATRPPTQNIPDLTDQGVTATTPAEKSALFNRVYAERMSPNPPHPQHPAHEHVQFTDEIPDDFPQDYVTPAQLADIIRALPNNTSPGGDGVRYEHLKRLPPAGIAVLAEIFSQLLFTARFPAILQPAVLKPLLKPNKPPSDPSSYRPIALLSCVGKLFEHFIYVLLLNELEERKLLPDEQFGFRPCRSTEGQLVRLVDYLTTAVNRGDHTYMAFLDVHAAFDKVPHPELLSFLHRHGFSARIRSLISTYLRNRTFSAQVDLELAPQVSITSGVPQGSKLGPLLYVVYTAEIPRVTHGFLGVYADDLAVATSAPSAAEARALLEAQVQGVLEWCSVIRTLVNADKTEVLHIAPSLRKPPEEKVTIGTTVVTTHNTPVRYLGLYLDANLNFTPHIRQAIAKVTVRFNQLRAHFPNGPAMRQYWLLLYKTTMQPIFLHAAAAYTARLTVEALKELSVRETSILRYALALPRRIRLKHLYEAAGVPPLRHALRKAALEGLQRLRSSKDPYIRKIATYEEHAYVHRRPGDLTDSTSSSSGDDYSDTTY